MQLYHSFGGNVNHSFGGKINLNPQYKNGFDFSLYNEGIFQNCTDSATKLMKLYAKYKKEFVSKNKKGFKKLG